MWPRTLIDSSPSMDPDTSVRVLDAVHDAVVLDGKPVCKRFNQAHVAACGVASHLFNCCGTLWHQRNALPVGRQGTYDTELPHQHRGFDNQ